MTHTNAFYDRLKPGHVVSMYALPEAMPSTPREWAMVIFTKNKKHMVIQSVAGRWCRLAPLVPADIPRDGIVPNEKLPALISVAEALRRVG